MAYKCFKIFGERVCYITKSRCMYKFEIINKQLILFFCNPKILYIGNFCSINLIYWNIALNESVNLSQTTTSSDDYILSFFIMLVNTENFRLVLTNDQNWAGSDFFNNVLRIHYSSKAYTEVLIKCICIKVLTPRVYIYVTKFTS